MFRLYFRDAQGKPCRYYETWAEPQRRRIIEHWGTLGETGETRVRGIRMLVPLERQFDEILAPLLEAGYAPLRDDERARLQVELTHTPDMASSIADACRDLDHLLTDVLGWTGLGETLSHTIEGDTCTITCRVVDPNLACERITGALSESGLQSRTQIEIDEPSRNRPG